ncbi:MAG TPA: chemotaxis protein CheW [Treponema sp.]|nr:MAG: hypothetical protein A2001_00405 [Treponema sp. GWC1_61_84]HCM26460.1 chemotaxis protein CheW [Treponema sp.]
METIRRKSLSGARFLSFELENEVYCMDILKAKELMGWTEATPLPQTPPHIRGIINLRGQVIPIVDLRIKFGLNVRENTKRTSIIVIDSEFEGTPLLIGVVVDAVREVVNIPDEKILKIPYINARIKAEYIRGIANSAEGMLIILDVEYALNDDDFVILKKIGEQK